MLRSNVQAIKGSQRFEFPKAVFYSKIGKELAGLIKLFEEGFLCD